MPKPTQTDIWVLFRTDGSGNGVVLCGTVFSREEANKWSYSGETNGAILLPLGGLAEGEDYA